MNLAFVIVLLATAILGAVAATVVLATAALCRIAWYLHCRAERHSDALRSHRRDREAFDTDLRSTRKDLERDMERNFDQQEARLDRLTDQYDARFERLTERVTALESATNGEGK